MNIEYKVVKDESKVGKVDKNGAPLECYTFTINGMPSMKWFKPCMVEGLPEDYYVQRCIGRLRNGRSREAFGGPIVTAGVDGNVFVSATQPPRGFVSRCAHRKRWVYTLDGSEASETFPTEAMAREACAIAAFMTRGKLGRLAEAAEAFRAEHNKACDIRVEGHGIVAHSECGARFAVSLTAGNAPRFKRMEEFGGS